MSGSTAASDIAEKRKLQAELNDAKASLDDEYISHSRTAQDDALDAESEAYTLSKEKYIEQLEEQLKDTKTLIENSIMDVLLNADTVYTELNNLADIYGVDLSDSLTQPWKAASDQAIAWKDELKRTLSASELELITHENGAVTAFSNGVATKLTGTWTTVQAKVKDYSDYLTSSELGNGFSRTLTGFGDQIQKIIDKWDGVKAAADAAYEAQTRQATVGGTNNSSEDNAKAKNDTNTTPDTPEKSYETTATLNLGNKTLTATGFGSTNAKANSAARAAILGEYEQYKGNSLASESAWQRTWRNQVKYVTKYAKGTTGTARDEWAITDESWIGEEITLAAGKTGHLRGMMKGSAVLPSNISENLVEWGKLSPDEMNLGGVVNNYVNAPTNDVDVANSLTIDGKRSNIQGVHDSIKDTYELIEDTVKNIDSVSQYYKPFVDEALTTPWVDAAEKTDEFNAAVNTNYDDIVNHIDENKESLEIALTTPYSNVADDINDFSQHAQKASVDDVVMHANEQSQALTTALSTGFNNASNATDAFKASGTSAVNAVKDSFTNEKTGLIKALNDTAAAAIKTKQAIDSVPTYSSGGDSSGTSVQAGEHYISSLGKNVSLSSNVAKWSSVATQALQKTGQYSYDNLLLLLHQMQTESSGNQNAINDWDVNAKNGTPSKGLMQVIDPTFQAYAMKGYDKDIYDPLSNIMAAIRYTTSRYGSLSKGWKGSGYAKGTTGVLDDQLSIVDELGEELILRANPTTGRLDYITMGTGIVPADLTENLMEWGKLNPNMMSMPDATPNISMINNAVTKPQYDFSFDSLVHVDNCDQSTLKDLEKMVDNKIDKFSRDLNYSIKKFSR